MFFIFLETPPLSKEKTFFKNIAKENSKSTIPQNNENPGFSRGQGPRHRRARRQAHGRLRRRAWGCAVVSILFPDVYLPQKKLKMDFLNYRLG